MPKTTLGRWTAKNEALTHRIKVNRVDVGLSVEAIAEKAGIKRGAYHMHMRDPELITLRELRAYCNALKIPEEDLLSAVYERRN